MREATLDLVFLSECCQRILSADTDEEMLEIKEDIANAYRESGRPETEVQWIMSTIDQAIEALENEEVTFDENGMIVPANREEEIGAADENVVYVDDEGHFVSEEVDTVATTGVDFDATNTPTQFSTLVKPIGVAGAAIVTCFALKSKIKKTMKKRNSMK